jgi:hypothetical protein
MVVAPNRPGRCAGREKLYYESLVGKTEEAALGKPDVATDHCRKVAAKVVASGANVRDRLSGERR